MAKKREQIAVVILAAGKSTRMKSEVSKVLHPLCGRPVLSYVLDCVEALKVSRKVIVLGHKAEDVRPHVPKDIQVSLQKRMCGTADAVKAALGALQGFKGSVLVLYGDIPLLKKETLSTLIKHHEEHAFDATLLTATLAKPTGYGRIVRDARQGIRGIVEEKDATDYEREIKEINTGIMLVRMESLRWALARIRPNNRKKEYYLTDAVGLLHKKNALLGHVKLKDFSEALGINSRNELATAHGIVQKRIQEELMKQGVSIVNPAAVDIAYGVKIGVDTVIYPFTVIESNVTIGKHCSIGPFAHVRAGSRIKDHQREGSGTGLTDRDQGFLRHFLY